MGVSLLAIGYLDSDMDLRLVAWKLVMRCLLFACLLLGALPSFALDRFQVEGYTLPNGLQLLLKPGMDRGHVAIRLVVGVGLDDFSCADKELPHLLEHLLFSGIDATGEGGLEERMQALGGEWNAYTSNAAKTLGLDSQIGSLVPGKQADLIILDRDVFSVDDEALSNTKVLKTFFAGKQVYAPDA